MRNGLRIPVLDGLAGIIVAGELDAVAEDGWATFAVAAAAELFSHTMELRG